MLMIGNAADPCGVQPRNPSVKPLPKAAIRGNASINIRVFSPEEDTDGICSTYSANRISQQHIPSALEDARYLEPA